MSKIINLTPHVVNVGTLAFKPEPKPARVESVVTEIGSVTTEEGIVHIVETHYGLVEHLPAKNTRRILYCISARERPPSRQGTMFLFPAN